MKFLMLLLSLLFISAPVAAQDFDYDTFKALPVLHDGRVKPLDSFARHYLQTFSAKERFEGRPAIHWLARTLFDPGNAADDKVFLIRNPRALSLSDDKTTLSYVELSAALADKQDTIRALMQRDPKEWNKDQQALLQYQEYALIYGQLLRSLTSLLPLNIAPPKALGIQGQTFSDLSAHADAIEKQVKRIVARKGDDPEKYSAEEKDIVTFAYQLTLLGNASEQNGLLAVLPTGDAWLSPWMAAKNNPALATWKDLATAWHADDAGKWDAAAQAIGAQSITPRLSAEVIYNELHPLGLAMILYLAAFLSASLHAIFTKIFLRRAAFSLVWTGIVSNALAIALRVFILERPPVGTLYESIIFVALIAALGGLIFSRKGRETRGIMAAALAGGILLFIAEAFATDDTMRMLVAVLNTNFWLATHVLCITIGYGWCILTALFAHFYLIGRASGRLAVAQHVALTQTTKSLALIALLFTTIGTILGGIWADQSWGRFWGWDPKENGALLIVLWLAWCLHGAIAGQLKSLTFMISLAALNIIVALAWFGVNLLGTGLHSYGFIDGVAAALFTFCAIELLLIGGLGYAAYRKDRQDA